MQNSRMPDIHHSNGRHRRVTVAMRARLFVAVMACAFSVTAKAADYAIERDIVFASPGGMDLRADVYTPNGSSAGRRPAVIVIHGGGWVRGEREDMHSISERLAEAGFVALNISYRFAPEHRFPAQLHDCKAAVRWARKNAKRYRIDPDRIAAWGYSAGAHLALLLGTTDPDDGLEGAESRVSSRVQAVVAGGTPTDLRGFDNSSLVRKLMGGREPGREGLYAAASPVTHVDRRDAPTFLYHGRRDLVVRFSQSELMAERLRNAGVKVELWPMPLGHVATFMRDDSAFAAGVKFLRRTLRMDTAFGNGNDKLSDRALARGARYCAEPAVGDGPRRLLCPLPG